MREQAPGRRPGAARAREEERVRQSVLARVREQGPEEQAEPAQVLRLAWGTEPAQVRVQAQVLEPGLEARWAIGPAAA